MTDETRIVCAPGKATNTFTIEFDLTGSITFDLDLQIQFIDAETGVETASHHIRQVGWDVAWLPRGRYEALVSLAGQPLSPRPQRVRALIWDNANGTPRKLGMHELADPWTPEATNDGRAAHPAWQLSGLDGVRVGDLSWNRGHDDWFFKHFDHASRVIVSLMLGDHDFLKGRVLDVGCGDGMTDLGVYLRCQPELIVGIDPSERYQLLPEVARENQLPDDWRRDPALRFEPHDGNAIPYEDDFFDVVLSWGSLEHIAGGYHRTLREIRRVLKPGGLFFCHPGLYYGDAGNHLGEFFDDPWIHLKVDADNLRKQVLAGRPDYIDRGGEFATPEDYWQWYTELNPITAGGFEAELRDMGFEPWRVALRTCPLVEFTPELQGYDFGQLANRELYVSAWNRK